MEFLIGGFAGMGACLFTNPLEVVKTRMQLQGELQAKGRHAVHYKNVFHSGYVIAKNDGLLALQKGLCPALLVQLVMNGLRLGTFQFADSRGYIRDDRGKLVFSKSVLVTAVGGVIGQFLSSPLFLIKTHLQSQAVKTIAVGHQHHHDGFVSALITIYKANGIAGLFRGAAASVPRILVGGPVQLISFEYAKLGFERYDYIADRPLLKSFLASMVGGIALTAVGTPFDLILTRIYNQPIDSHGKGILYKNYADCIRKVYNSEGVMGFYKGIGPMYLRLGPHTVLCLIFWDQLKSLHAQYARNDLVLV
ncbi:solute carrier family 25 member 35-like [Cylas formicarius]|uniref:solute carrier family 25 member 35-like n=1 Tax=Cylas formicarius TaxID=197179 RepID=UPI002958561C|nr:solute carrier family 25 member 35-like [Cylas formicarius]